MYITEVIPNREKWPNPDSFLFKANGNKKIDIEIIIPVLNNLFSWMFLSNPSSFKIFKIDWAQIIKYIEIIFKNRIFYYFHYL